MKDYKWIWNNLSTTVEDGVFYVGYHDDEEEIRRNGQRTSSFLREVLGITPGDSVLEIGCGVARVGRELAPSCGEWHGADISGNMIAHAARRTEGIPNVYLHELPTSNLAIFNDGYFDCVYSTIVFMHLDKVEMFNYMRDAHRVLAPGGRAYFDTYNLLAPEAWVEFRKILEAFPSGERPGHVSQFSTRPEMQKFMQEAGFVDIEVDDSNEQLVVAVGRKREAEAEGRVERPREAVNAEVAARLEAEKAAREREVVRVVDRKAILPHELWLQVAENLEAKSEYIARLEGELARKDGHIARLEATLRKHERLMRRLPVRVALRLVKKP